METSHTPTLQGNSGVPKAVIPLFKVREGNVMLGKSGRESRGQAGSILWNTEGLYITVLQLLANLLSHVH
jgi:hypothetical protein